MGVMQSCTKPHNLTRRRLLHPEHARQAADIPLLVQHRQQLRKLVLAVHHVVARADVHGVVGLLALAHDQHVGGL